MSRGPFWVMGTMLLLLLALWLLRGEVNLETSGNASNPTSLSGAVVKRVGTDQWGGESRPGRRVTPIVRNKTHEVSDLNSFYHPPIELEDTSLDEALNRLVESYREICEETGETILPLRWEVEGKPGRIRHAKLTGSLIRSCRLLAMHAGMICEVRNGAFVFSEVPSGPEQTRQWLVPPTFTGFLQELQSGQSAQQDPFTGEFVEDPLTKSLRGLGVLKDGESVEMDLSTGAIEVRAGEGTLELINGLVEMSADEKSVQMRYEFTHEKGNEAVIMPSVITRSGQSATIEIGKEFVELGEEGESENAFVGVKVSFTGELYGFGERTSVLFEKVDPPSEQEMEAYQESGKLAELDLEGEGLYSHVTKTFENRRDNSALKVSFNDDLSALQVSLRSQRIDASGQPIEGP